MQRGIESFTAEEKVGLYQLAIQLFDNGYSHPQIIERFKKIINDNDALIITDKAFKGEWDKLYAEGARMLAKKKLWNEAVEELSVNEPYRDVIELLVNDIYMRDFDLLHAEDKFKKKI